MNKIYYFGFWIYPGNKWEHKIHSMNHHIVDYLGGHFGLRTAFAPIDRFYGLQIAKESILILKLKYDIRINDYDTFFRISPNIDNIGWDEFNKTSENILDDIIKNEYYI